MSGVLDWFHDRLPELPKVPPAGNWWCKCTIASFRANEIIEYVEDFGWQARPLLIVRDVRYAMDSLITRSYGRNSTTAEDPPLRTRFRRFLDDWKYFRNNGLPIIRFEDFTTQPEAELARVSSEMGLAWKDDMVNWPKPRDEVWLGGGANQGFIDSLGHDLYETLRKDATTRALRNLHKDDVAWLDDTFAEYNAALGYPSVLDSTLLHGLREGWQPPKIANASRYGSMKRSRLLYRVLPGLRRLRRRAALEFKSK
jgi:hypothetical protein